MNAVERAERRDIETDILAYVREMQQRADVVEESICNFLVITRRRKITAVSVRDRLDYLTSAGLLKATKIWDGGEKINYTITSYGMDVMDGNVPPPGWTRD